MRALPKGILVSFCAAASFVGCGDRSLRPLTPCTNAGVSQSVPIDDVKNVDLLFMVDDSGSMREEQQKLRREFPRMVRALVTGDIDGDMVPDGPAVSSLRVGVVTSDMGVGGIGTLAGEIPIAACGAITANTVNPARANYGDDGVLRRDQTSVAASGSDPAVNCDVDGTPGDDSVTAANLPAYLTFDGSMSANTAAVNEYVRRVSCHANTGNAGCGFEQQLESVLKAITPPNVEPTDGPFYAPATEPARALGHGCAVYAADGSCVTTDVAQGGDVVNAGWFREDSLLAVVVISDEDDCSARDRVVFDTNLATGPNADPYGKWQAQTRCQRREAELVHPVQRYVDGLLARRAESPKRLVYAVITGLPPTMTDEDDEGTLNIQEILDSAPMQTTFLDEVRPAGPGGSNIVVPSTSIQEVCHHTVAQVSTPGTGGTVRGSTTISNAMFGAVVPVVGMGVSGSNVAAGTVITAVTGSGPYTLTVDAAANVTAAASVLRLVQFSATGTGDLTNGSTTIANATFTGSAIPVVGLALTGTGLQPNTTITAVTGTGPYTLTISLAATATATSAITAPSALDVSAVPARRIVGVARGLQTATGGTTNPDLALANAIVQSICVDDFRPAVERILRLIQANLAGGCLPRKLIRNALNEVNCGVFVTLPAGQTCAANEAVYDLSRTQNVTVAGNAREKCTMHQVPVTAADVASTNAPAGVSGWFYDDYTNETATCPSPQRISFTMDAKPPKGAIMDFGCTQPVQDGDLAVDISSECGAGSACSFPSAEASDAFILRYNLPVSFDPATDFVCETYSNTCQIGCASDADCPGGFVCYDSVGMGQTVCVNPTCGSGF